MAQKLLSVESPSILSAVFGAYDEHVHQLEQAFHVQIVSRDTQLKITGEPDSINQACRALDALFEMARGGEAITDQAVRYLVSLTDDTQVERAKHLSDSCICVTASGKPIRPKTLGQKKYIEAMEKNTVILGIGPAGTGKTFLAVAAASKALRNKQVSRIILTRPAVEAGEKLGFLPGDLQNKIDPYLRPLHDALFEMLGAEAYQKHIERGTIEIAPLAYMRGRTLDDSFIILDEAQNTTPEQMKMFLTRLGSGSKAVVTGDITQTDLPRGTRSGLVEAMKILRGIEDIAIHEFTERDVVRHKLVQRIILAYEKYERERRAKSEKYHVAKKDRDK